MVADPDEPFRRAVADPCWEPTDAPVAFPMNTAKPIEFPGVVDMPATADTGTPAPAFHYRPTGTFIQIDTPALQDRSIGGIILPQNARQLSWLTRRALKVGPDCKLVKEGDTVLLAREGMTEVRHDGALCAFTQEEKVVAVVTNGLPFGGVHPAVPLPESAFPDFSGPEGHG